MEQVSIFISLWYFLVILAPPPENFAQQNGASDDNDYKLDSCYDFKPHEYLLGSRIDSIFLPSLWGEPSVAAYTATIKAEVVCFNDAHAKYSNALLDSIRFYPPLPVKVELDDAGTQVFVVATANRFAPQSIDYHDENLGIDVLEFAGRRIESINGLLPLDYYLQVVACDGHHHDVGTRLNYFLRTNEISSTSARVVEGGLPDGGEFNVVFTDGTSLNTRWGVDASLFSTSLTEMIDHFIGTNIDASFFIGFLKQYEIETICDDELATSPFLYQGSRPLLQPKPKETGRSLSESERGELGVRDCRDFYTNHTDFGSLDVANRNTEDDVCHANHDTDSVLCLVCYQQWPSSGGTNGHLVVSKLKTRGKDVIIFKFDSFGFDKDLSLLFGLQVAAEIAKKEANEELMIDVVGNVGGSIALGFLFNDFLFRGNPRLPAFSSPIDACEWYNHRESDPLDYIISDKEAGFVNLSSVGDPIAQLEMHAKRLGIIRELDRNMPETLAESFGFDMHVFERTKECIDSLVVKYSAEAKFPLEDLQSEYEQCASEKLSCQRCGILDGYYPPSNVKPPGSKDFMSVTDTCSIFSPPSYDYYKELETIRFGGFGDMFFDFTAKSLLDCPFYPRDKFEHLQQQIPALQHYRPLKGGIKSIKYITDGTCGSACSQSTTRAYIDGMATVISYGGIEGQPIDISSFNGGNIDHDVENFWQSYATDLISIGIRTEVLPPSEAIVMPIPMRAHITMNNRQHVSV